MNLLNILRSTIGQKALGFLYDDFLGFRIIIDIDFLKCDS